MDMNKKSLTPQVKHVLQNLYFSPSAAGGLFSSTDTLFKMAKRQYPYLNITKQQISDFLMTKPSYTQNRQRRLRYRTEKIIVGGMNELHQADLIDMHQYSNFNDGIKFLLLVVDVFSKFIWIRELKDKTAHSVLEAFESIYQKYSDFPVELSTDKGKEFHNKLLTRFFEKNDVKFFSSEGNTKAQFAERSVRTIKRLILTFLGSSGTKRYLNSLQQIVRNYNNTYKHSLQMAPSEVSPKNMKKVFFNIYGKNISTLISEDIISPKHLREKNEIKVGDLVRIQTKLGVFAKTYQNTFPAELFKISKDLPSNPIRYHLQDLQGTPIKGTFYASELQKSESNSLVKIEKILEKKRQNGVLFYLVKWLNYPDQFNSLIPADSLYVS